MEWSQSYSSSWRVFRVNRKTWADGALVADIDSVSVTRTADGSLLESGTLEVTGDFETDYYRIVMTAQQGGEVERVDVATLLFEVESGKDDYGTSTKNVNGHSVLYPASSTAIVAGEYAPAGVDGAQYAKELLESAINAPVEVEGSFTLVDNVVHNLGTPILDAAWAVLDAGGFVIQIDGRGVVHIRPRPTEPALEIENASLRLLSNGIDYSKAISDVPNRYVVIVDNNITIAANNDPESPVSTVNRGYCVDMIDKNPVLINGESYGEYANRKLREASIVKDTKTYTREYAPDVFLYSIVRFSLSNIRGDFRVESQAVNCGKGITLTEKSSMEVNLW